MGEAYIKCPRYGFSWGFMIRVQHVGSKFPNQEWNPHPLQWKHRVLIT